MDMDTDLANTMTPEELEAINAEQSPEEKLVMRQATEAEKDDDDEGENEGDDKGATGEEGKADDKPEDGQADDGKAGEPEAKEPEPEPAKPLPRYDAQLPSDYDDQIKALKTRDAELRQKYKDGEIDIDERDAGLAELTEQREQLLVARAKAEISQEMSQQTAQQQWQATINKALNDFAKPENGGIDYRKDAEKQADLDQFVKFLANKEENSDKPMEWFLQEAHRRVQALHGVAPAPKRETVDDAKAKRKPPVDSMPKTLAQVPGSDGPGDVAGEFADLEALEGWELEQALAKLSPTAREKFLRGG